MNGMAPQQYKPEEYRTSKQFTFTSHQFSRIIAMDGQLKHVEEWITSIHRIHVYRVRFLGSFRVYLPNRWRIWVYIKFYEKCEVTIVKHTCLPLRNMWCSDFVTYNFSPGMFFRKKSIVQKCPQMISKIIWLYNTHNIRDKSQLVCRDSEIVEIRK